jgi:hypothetical protein
MLKRLWRVIEYAMNIRKIRKPMESRPAKTKVEK